MLIDNFYSKKYPNTDSSAVNKRIINIQDIYKNNYFPSMNVSWKVYPNNIGHMHYSGCFRCHDGEHVDDKGNAIPKDCNTCHLIVSQTINDTTRTSQGLEFQHPVDPGENVQDLTCTMCLSA